MGVGGADDDDEEGDYVWGGAAPLMSLHALRAELFESQALTLTLTLVLALTLALALALLLVLTLTLTRRWPPTTRACGAARRGGATRRGLGRVGVSSPSPQPQPSPQP